MNAIADFSALMKDIRAHQDELSALYQKISRPEEKEMLGHLMSEIENARQQAEGLVPATLQQIKDSADRTKKQAQQQLAELAKRLPMSFWLWPKIDHHPNRRPWPNRHRHETLYSLKMHNHESA